MARYRRTVQLTAAFSDVPRQEFTDDNVTSLEVPR